MLPLNRDWSLVRPPQAVLPPNAGLAYRLMDAQGYDSLYLRRYKALANAIEGKDTSPPENGNMLFITNVSSPLFPLLGVRRVLAPEPLPLPLGPSFEANGVTVTEDPRVLPRAFVARHWRSLPEDEVLPALARLAASRTGALAEEAILSSVDLAEAGLDGALPVAGARDAESEAAVRMTSPNRVEVHVTTSTAGLLVLLDNHYPGWLATIRRSEAVSAEQVLRADATFRAVRLPMGTSQVYFRFEPASLRLGFFLAVLGVGAISAVAAALVTRRRVTARRA
jgi:hypothetical protein